MRYWNENPELYDRIIAEQMRREGLVTAKQIEDEGEFEVVNKFMKNDPDSWRTAVRAEQEHWADRTDDAMNKAKEERTKNG